jgi:predicted glycosyltransferase
LEGDNPERVLLYAHDGIGIGHTVRSCVLASAIRRRWPHAEVLFTTGSPVARSFLPPGIGLAALPIYPIVPDNLALPALRELKEQRRALTERRQRLLLDVVREFRPRVALIDHMPLGKRDELLPAVLELREHRAKLLLGYRRIAEDVATTRSLLGYQPVRQSLTDHFAAVLVYAPSWIRDRLGPLPGVDIAQIHVGFVCRQCSLGATTARQILGLSRDQVVFACGLGGGRHAWSLARSVLKAWSGAYSSGRQLLLYLGPMLDLDEGELAPLTRQPGVRVIRDSTDFPLGIAAANAVVTTGGYNSVLESLRQGRRLFIIPNQQKEVEQERSAGLLAELGLADIIRQKDDWQHVLEEAFASPLNNHGRPRLSEADFCGDVRTADLVGRNDRAPLPAAG